MPDERLTVDLGGGRISYRDLGRGAPIVFVHGVFVNGDLWRRVAAPLAAAHRCLLPDLPLGGHRHPFPREADLTPPALARLVLDFLAALDLRDVTLVGNDTGGALCQIAVASGAADAGRVARLLLTNCDAFELFPPRSFLPLVRASRVAGRAVVALFARWMRSASGPKLFFSSVAHAPPDPELVASFFEPLADRPIRRDVAKVLAGLAPRFTLDAATRFRAFDRPVLVVWGEDDALFPMALGERLAAAFPHAELMRVAHCRTFVPLDQPETLARAIGRFASLGPER